MDYPTPGENAVTIFFRGHGSYRSPADLFDKLPESLLHVFDLQDLLITPLEVKPQHRNTPAVDGIRIDFAIRILVRNHLAATRKPNNRPIVSTVVVLQLSPIAAARWKLADVTHETVGRHSTSAPNLNVVTAGEIEVAVAQPPRHKKVGSPGAVFVVGHVVH